MAADDWRKQVIEEKKTELALNLSKNRDQTYRHGIWATVCGVALIVTFSVAMFTIVRVKSLDNVIKLEQIHSEAKK